MAAAITAAALGVAVTFSVILGAIVVSGVVLFFTDRDAFYAPFEDKP